MDVSHWWTLAQQPSLIICICCVTWVYMCISLLLLFSLCHLSPTIQAFQAVSKKLLLKLTLDYAMPMLQPSWSLTSHHLQNKTQTLTTASWNSNLQSFVIGPPLCLPEPNSYHPLFIPSVLPTSVCPLEWPGAGGGRLKIQMPAVYPTLTQHSYGWHPGMGRLKGSQVTQWFKVKSL